MKENDFLDKNIEEEKEFYEDHDFLLEDDIDMDIIIEIEDEVNLVNFDQIKSSELEDIVLSNHKIEGKHSLKYDSIFKGKKEDPLDEYEYEYEYNSNTIEVDKSSLYHQESIDNENYVRSKLVRERIYDVLNSKTNLSFSSNRRKPSKIDFNIYYSLLVKELKNDSFTNIEIFNELSVYFSDNLFNMFKLLDNKWRNLLIDELQDHIGKNNKSKEISNRNIYEGTEIEFKHDDGISTKLITGVVLETYYYDNKFKVDSYENIYIIDLDMITKILNNTKFKYNLNKLNNIDFL
jgi:hypothetical protein